MWRRRMAAVRLLLGAAAVCSAGAVFPSVVIDADGAPSAVTPSDAAVARAARVRAAAAADPYGAAEELRRALAALAPDDGDRLPLLDVLAEVAAAVHDHHGEVAARQQALVYRVEHVDARASPAQVLTSYVGLAQALMHARRYGDAVDVLREADAILRGRLRPAMAATLTKLQAQLADCQGDVLGALKTLVRALKEQDAAGVTLTPAQVVDDVLLQLRVLSHVAAAAEEAGEEGHQHAGGNATLLASLGVAVAPKMARLVEDLLARGPWRDRRQLPRHYVPGLRAAPWWSPADVPGWHAVVTALAAAAPALRDEYAALAAEDGGLRHEHECIHDAAGGEWRYRMVVGPEVRHKDAAGCDVRTPAACALLAALADADVPGLRVLRAGYSAIDAGTTLRPHFGLTNGQLKFHVGVVVPHDAAGNPCAFLRVADETRVWQEGKVLFFDDSFLHSVHSTCRRTRVVFQLVVAHPDLVASGAPLPFAPQRTGPADGALTQPDGH